MTAAKLPSTSRRTFMGCSLGVVGIMAAPALHAQGTTPLRLVLEGRLDGAQSVFLAALDKGYFQDEGLAVTIESGNGSRDALARLASGGSDLAFCDVNTMIRVRDETPASDIKAVLMVYDRTPFAIIGRRSRGISDDLRSLEGKKLGAPASDNAASAWPVFRMLHQLDLAKISLETIGAPVREPMLAAGEIDAVFGSAVSVFVNLKSRNVPIDDIVVLAMADFGVVLYGNAIIAGPQLREQRPEVIRGFNRALIRGIRDCVSDPASGITPLLRTNESLRKEVETERLQLTLTQNLLTGWVRENGFGGISPERLDVAVTQLATGQPFKTKPVAANLFDDRFLPDSDDRKII